jgi:predicted nucleic-acid-binding protein
LIITADTNVLVRAVVGDDPQQSAMASAALRQADAIAVPLPVLCELVWVLRRAYGFAEGEISGALRALIDADNVRLDRPAAEAGLALLEAGGDFAEGVIAHEGQWLGGAMVVSFDRHAVVLLKAQGIEAELLS